MPPDISEPDWKVLRRVHPLALERFCGRVLGEVERIMHNVALSQPCSQALQHAGLRALVVQHDSRSHQALRDRRLARWDVDRRRVDRGCRARHRSAGFRQRALGERAAVVFPRSEHGRAKVRSSLCRRQDRPLQHPLIKEFVLPGLDQRNQPASFNLEMLITTQLDSSRECGKFDRSRLRTRYVEERLVRLGMKVHVILQGTARGTVIGEVARLGV